MHDTKLNCLESNINSNLKSIFEQCVDIKPCHTSFSSAVLPFISDKDLEVRVQYCTQDLQQGFLSLGNHSTKETWMNSVPEKQVENRGSFDNIKEYSVSCGHLKTDNESPTVNLRSKTNGEKITKNFGLLVTNQIYMRNSS